METLEISFIDILWTRNPFDRMMVANARVTDCILITLDQTMQKNYTLARW